MMLNNELEKCGRKRLLEDADRRPARVQGVPCGNHRDQLAVVQT